MIDSNSDQTTERRRKEKDNRGYANTGKRIGTRPANLLYCKKEESKQKEKI